MNPSQRVVSETQQVSEFLGERVKLRASRERSYQLSAVSYQIKTKEPVGWVERSETQQVSELLGERVKLRA